MDIHRKRVAFVPSFQAGTTSPLPFRYISPKAPPFFGHIAQLDRALASEAKGRKFESRYARQRRAESVSRLIRLFFYGQLPLLMAERPRFSSSPVRKFARKGGSIVSPGSVPANGSISLA